MHLAAGELTASDADIFIFADTRLCASSSNHLFSLDAQPCVSTFFIPSFFHSLTLSPRFQTISGFKPPCR